ncbi:OmpA family protein [Spirochaeta dissipatitropha]
MKAKKQILILAGIELALFLLILVVVMIMQSQGRVYTQRPIVFRGRSIVTYVVGDVQISPDGSSWQNISIGDRIQEGLLIRTGNDSRVDIRFSNDSGIRLEENTNLRIDTLDVRETDLFVETGTIFSRFSRRFIEQQFRIRSETATAGIRGTAFSFSVQGNATKVSVHSGLVELIAKSFPESPVMIYPGAYSVVRPGRVPDSPRSLDRSEQQDLTLKIQNIQHEQVLFISRTIQFEANTDRILPDSLPELEFVLKELQKNRHSVRIDGHTANIGAESAMADLSLQRAKRIRDYLIDNGIPERRLQVNGAGASKPIADNSSTEGRALNRRVEFIIID